MPKFTEDQQKAIDLEGKNIIVSAGAGSGKTAVLSERVLRKLKQGISISQLLVLTFTNEAAGEMKQRIRQKISKDPDLQDQLDLIDSAYITTFDSFSLSMVKKYHYLLGVDKNINIMDASILEMKKNEYLDTIFNERYEKKDANFLKLINDFCVKEDQSIKEAVHSIMESVDKLSNKKEFLTTYVDKYYSTAHINKIIEEYENNIKEQMSYTKDMYSYNLQNIKAIPYSLTKVSAINSNNKLYPFIEYYTCTDEEKDALINKLKYDGMTIMKISTINQYLHKDKTFIKGMLIRVDLHKDSNYINNIYNELMKGVYI